jgi:hypothetical protein
VVVEAAAGEAQDWAAAPWPPAAITTNCLPVSRSRYVMDVACALAGICRWAVAVPHPLPDHASSEHHQQEPVEKQVV